MKTKILTISILSIFWISASFSQNIPNRGFENWEMRFLYDEPDYWNTGNQESFLGGEQTTIKTTDSYSGMYAMRLETVVTDESTFFGYAFCNGRITNGELGDTLYFDGGIPVSDAPDSLFGYFKFDIAANDTALVLVSFKKAGDIISQNFYQIWGTQDTYTRLGFEIETMAETPDTALVAFTCSNPENPMPGGWIQVDSIRFGGITDTIWNADFEYWEDYSYQDPTNWFTTNLFSYLFGGDIAATPTPDAYSGDYALRLEAVETMVPAEGGLTESVAGFAIPYEGTFDFRESLPTFTVDYNPTMLTGYYKYTPVLNDTAMIYIGLIDDEDNVYETGTFLTASATYQEFEVPLDYPAGITITEAGILFNTSKYFLDTSESGELGTLLYLDDLDLFNPCDTFPAYEIVLVDEPDCDDNTAILDAGTGWDEYLWSNSEATQTITVTVTETSTYSVTVTNNETGCEFSDEVEISPATGCETAIRHTESRTPYIVLFPNPVSGILNIEFQNLKSGEYTIELIDITGKLILSKKIILPQNLMKTSIDLSNYAEGLYMIKIQGDSLSECKKLMIN